MGIKDDRNWYREWYSQHVGNPPNGATLWERENRARMAKARRRQRWLGPLRRIPSLIVAIVVIAVVAQAGYYLTHGLDPVNTMRAIGYDWRYYGERTWTSLTGGDNADASAAPTSAAPDGSLVWPNSTAAAMAFHGRISP
jgi:hypothetical protein